LELGTWNLGLGTWNVGIFIQTKRLNDERN
jgi:hypothetical protein